MCILSRAAWLALMGMSIAAPSVAQTLPSDSTATAPQHQLYRGSKIIGSDLRDPKDQKIGEIKDLMLDSQRGEVAYAVVSFSEGLGIGMKLYAVPWQVLQPSDDGKSYILHADKETIAMAPGFDKARWPDMSDRTWSADVERYWSRMVGRGFGSNRLPPGPGGIASPRPLSKEQNSSGR